MKSSWSAKSQFNTWSYFYDLLFGINFSYWNKKAVEHLDLRENVSILDVGCGTGILLKMLSKSKYSLNLSGVDVSPKMVKKARNKLSNEVSLDVGDVVSLPYTDNSFDIITCSTSFHHYQDPQKALREMYRVLKPSGRLYILDPYTDGLRRIIVRGLSILFLEPMVHFYSKQQIRTLLIDTQFRTIHQSSISFYKLLTTAKK